MKKNHYLITTVCVLLLCAFAINMSGCTTTVSAENLMDGISPNPVENVSDLTSESAAITDFALRLYKSSFTEGANSLISPISVLCAFAMVTNGANGQTLSQIENSLGLSTAELNAYLHTYINALPQGEKYKLAIANSIWFTDDSRFSVNRDFLQLNADYYGADIYKAPFNKRTLNDINNWVKNESGGMINKILNEIPQAAVMYLVNTLAFEAEWSEIYEKNQVTNGTFTTEHGEKQSIKLMESTESRYLEDKNAIGFIKYYKGNKYAFVALLPNDGVSVSDYLASLDGESLNKLLSEPNYATVYASLPKFESEYTLEMSDALKALGITNAFNPDLADFSKLGTSSKGNIYISRVLHKTFISVAEKGTKAGAATVIEMNDASAPVVIEPKYVCLDRPFIYMLIDTETNIPFFIGTQMSIK